MLQGRLAAAWLLGILAYASGLLVSTALDLPSGPTIVWLMAGLALGGYALSTQLIKEFSP